MHQLPYQSDTTKTPRVWIGIEHRPIPNVFFFILLLFFALLCRPLYLRYWHEITGGYKLLT